MTLGCGHCQSAGCGSNLNYFLILCHYTSIRTLMTNRRKPIKIVFDATPMLTERTGIAYYTERLVTHMAKKYPEEVQLVGFYYNFLGKRNSSHLPRLKNLRYTRASIIPSKVVYQLRRWGIEFPIEFLALTPSADFILYPNFLSYPSLRGTPSAPVIHDLTYLDLPEYVSAKLRRDLIRFVPKAIERAAFVATVSEFSKQGIAEHYAVPLKNILVTPVPPVPAAPVSPAEGKKILKELGITKKYMLFVGTVEPRKNIPALIAAYRKLPEAVRRDYALVIAGRIGWNCETEVADLKAATVDGLDVIHPGYISDHAREVLYANASLFTSASHYEGFGMPVLEAMNHGIPCALSDIPVFREVADDAAAYFDCHDPQDIAHTLAQLLSNPARLTKLGASASKHAASYSWDAVAGNVYESICVALKKEKPTIPWVPPAAG